MANYGFRPFQYGNVSVTSSATPIHGADLGTSGVLVVNTAASGTVYIGDANVTAANGFPLAAGASVTIPCTAAIYGITSGASITVGFIQVG